MRIATFALFVLLAGCAFACGTEDSSGETPADDVETANSALTVARGAEPRLPPPAAARKECAAKKPCPRPRPPDPCSDAGAPE